MRHIEQLGQEVRRPTVSFFACAFPTSANTFDPCRYSVRKVYNATYYFRILMYILYTCYGFIVCFLLPYRQVPFLHFPVKINIVLLALLKKSIHFILYYGINSENKTYDIVTY